MILLRDTQRKWTHVLWLRYFGAVSVICEIPVQHFSMFFYVIIGQCVVYSSPVIIPHCDLWPLIPCWHTVGWEAAGAGLQPGQVILKVNGNNVNHSDYQEVLEHFTAQHTHQEPPQSVRGHMKTLTYHLFFIAAGFVTGQSIYLKLNTIWDSSSHSVHGAQCVFKSICVCV